MMTCLMAMFLFGPPQDYDFEELLKKPMTSEADFKATESAFVAAVASFEKQSLEQFSKPQAATAFAMKWIEGTPTLTVDVDQDYLHLAEENPPLMVIAILTTARHAIENPKDSDEAHKLAGLEAALNMYQNSKGAKPDPKVDALVEAWQADKLAQAIQKLK